MAIRQIRMSDDEILRKQSRVVEVVDEKIKELLDDMVETMHKYNGVGLAGHPSRDFKKSYSNRFI